MKKILSKLDSFYIPFDTGKMALFFSILALAYVASASNTPCLSANTCAVGSDPVFEDNVGVKGGTAFTATIDASLITNDRNIQLPDTDGILAVTSTLAGNKMLRTNVSGEIEVDSTTYPVTLSPDLPLYTSATGEVTAGAFDVTLLGVGTGTSNQVLTVGGGSALTWSTITGVPTLTANKPLISDGLGALTTASLTADKIMVTDTNGNLDTTSVYPLSFSANKPVVTDAVGNLTDITLNANEPVITDGNGNLATSLINPTTDIAVGSATEGQILEVGSGSALVWANPSGGGSVSLTAKGSITGGRVVAGIVDSNELKVENITSFQSSVNDTDYNSTDSWASDQRYNHYNAIANKYLQCFSDGGYMKCRTGSFNATTNEITWDTEVQVSSYVNYLNANALPYVCAYADDSAHNYYICTLRTSSSNDNYIRYVSFYIDSTGQLQVGDNSGRFCWGNYSYTYGNCGTALPVWDMQTNTWVIVSAVNGDSSTNGTTSDWGIVISTNFVPNSNSTCNGVNCGFPSVYDNALKVNGPYSNTNSFNSTYWQVALDQRNTGYNRLHAVALDNGDSNDYEYAIISKADSSGSGGNMEDAGWSAVHLERYSIGGSFFTGPVIENFNDKSVNTGTVNQFCGGNTNNVDSLHDNVYGQGTTDVGFYFIYTCTENTSYGGSGIYSIYGNFFEPNPATNTLDMANAESIRLWETNSSVFGGGLGTSNQYFTSFKSMFKDDVIVIGGANYMAEPDGTYLGCNSSYYCGGTIVTQWNSTKTGFTPLSFKAYRPNDYAYANPIYNSDEDIFTFYFTNVSSGNGMGYITPTIDKNRGSWLGFVKDSATDGDIVTVNIISGKATGLTGLVAGTNYYVGGDGSLSISGESSNQFCKAINTTECLITKIN